jgi:AcrR family transcriptional regulator
LFAKRSYHPTTVAQICTRAGMATGGFYAHFGSKAEIYAAVVRQISADIGRRAGSVVMDLTWATIRSSRYSRYADLLFCVSGRADLRTNLILVVNSAESVLPTPGDPAPAATCHRYARFIPYI